jgi:outer membrane receptor for ferrienterochelin and colicins
MHLCASSPKIKKLDSLKAEKASSFMVGSDYYDKKFELSCNLYYTTIKDKIYFTDEGAPSGYDFVWTNAEEEAKVFSLELGGHYKIFDNLLFKSDLNLVRAKYDETTEVGEKNGENIRRTPQYTLGLGLEFMKNGWDIIFDGEIVGPMYIDLAWEEAGIDPSAIDEKVVQKTSTFSIWNIKVSKKLKKNTILFAGIKNLFDEVQENRSHKYDSVNGYEKIKAAAADAAFMYKPITGREMYCGMEIEF